MSDDEDFVSPRTSDSVRKLLSARTNEYHSQLRGSVAEKYLMEQRGFTQKAIDFFQLGYVETPMKNDRGHLGRVSIPYLTRTGVVSMRSVAIPSVLGDPTTRPDPKYLPWMTGDITRPFNVTSLDTAEEVYIIEGEFDTITAWMLGLYAVGVAGVSNWKKAVYRPMFRYRKVNLIGDNDDMGQGAQFCKEVAKSLGGASITLMPKGHDLNSYFVEHGSELTLKHIIGDPEDDE